MRATFDYKQRSAFSIGRNQLQSLVEVLRQASEELRISASCTDDATRQFSSLSELLEYENHKERRILDLCIRTEGKSEINGGWLSIQINWQSGNTFEKAYSQVRINGEGDHALLINTKIRDVIEGTKPWYAWFAKIDVGFFVYFAMILALGLMIAGGVYDLLGYGPESPPSEPIGPWYTRMTVALFAYALYGLLAGTLVVFRRIFFPAGVFLIGQEIARNKTKEWIRRLSIGLLATAICFVLLPKLLF